MYRGQMTPAHDPITGDAICWKCKPSQPSLRPQPESNQWRAIRPEAFPLYLRAEMAKAGKPDEHYESMKNKCINHFDEEWVIIDLTGLNCLCLSCSKDERYQHTRRGFIVDTTPVIRDRLVTALIAPLGIKLISSLQTNQGENKDASGGQNQDQMSVPESAHCMSSTANALLDWVEKVEASKKLLCDKVTQMRSIIQDNDSRQCLETVLGEVDRHFESACVSYINSIHPLVRLRQVISGTLFEGIRLLGLTVDSNSKDALTKVVIVEALKKRTLSEASTGEELIILRTLTCLRETLTKGDSLLLQLTKEDVEGIPNQQGGLKEVLNAVNSKVKSISIGSLVTEGKVDTLLVEAKGLVEEVLKVIPLLYEGRNQEYWKDGIVKWRKEQASPADR